MVAWLCDACYSALFPEGSEETCVGRLIELKCRRCGVADAGDHQVYEGTFDAAMRREMVKQQPKPKECR